MRPTPGLRSPRRLRFRTPRIGRASREPERRAPPPAAASPPPQTLLPRSEGGEHESGKSLGPASERSATSAAAAASAGMAARCAILAIMRRAAVRRPAAAPKKGCSASHTIVRYFATARSREVWTCFSLPQAGPRSSWPRCEGGGSRRAIDRPGTDADGLIRRLAEELLALGAVERRQPMATKH